MAHPEVTVLLVSLEDAEDMAEEVGACGAVSFLNKRDPQPATLRAFWNARGAAPEQHEAA